MLSQDYIVSYITLATPATVVSTYFLLLSMPLKKTLGGVLNIKYWMKSLIFVTAIFCQNQKRNAGGNGVFHDFI